MKKQKSRALSAAMTCVANPWSSLLVMSAALPLEQSFADDECGAHVAGVTVVCDASANPYASGITYPNVSDDLDLRLEPGTVVELPPSNNVAAVSISGTGAAFTVDAAEGASIAIEGPGTSGIYVIGWRSIDIESGAEITAGFSALRAALTDAAGSDDVRIFQRETGSIRVTEDFGQAIQAANNGTGSVMATSAGIIESDARGVFAIYAGTNNPDGGVATTQLTETGSIVLNSEWGAALYSLSQGGGAHASSAGTITMTLDDPIGLLSVLNNATGAGDATAELLSTGTISSTGARSHGIWTLNRGLGASSAQSMGVITTLGADAIGIQVEIDNAASAAQASVTVDGAGSIATSGDGAYAIRVFNAGSGAGTVELLSNAKLTTQGAAAHGVNGVAVGSLSLSQSAASSIEVSGPESIGANLVSDSDASLVLNGVVASTGEYGVGAVTVGTAGTAQQTIEATGSVSGGWQADVAGVGATSNRPSAGVLLDGAVSAHLINRGVVTAGSDRAVVAQGADVTVDNSGILSGFIELGGGVNVFNNAASGTFEVRHFADTDGDAVRDTKRVAIANFGSPTSTFNNASGAIVRLAEVANESAVDASGYYVPTTGIDERALDASVYDLGRAGIVQGQFVNLGTFNHAGVIDLRGPAIGNTLVITGASSAGGAPGGGVFVSDGGTLLLNAVLNEGIAPGSQSGSIADILVVDSTQMGSGATTIVVDRTEGVGAPTPGNGVLLVEVRNKAQSAPDVFTLDSDFSQNGLPSIVAGAYAYSLFHNGTDSDAADGNWYLRSSALDLVPPDTEPESPPPPEAPRYQPGVPLYESYSTNLHALTALPTLQQRVGNRVWGVDENLEPTAVWGRIDGANTRARAPTSTAAVDQSVDMWKLQLGFDRLITTSEKGGRLVASVAVEYGEADSTVRSIFGDGYLESEGYALGTMWTWYGHTGFYLDVQAQTFRFHSDLQSNLLGPLVRDHDGRARALSLELGKTVELSDIWSITPQTQLRYASVRFDRFVDPVDAVVSTDDANSRAPRFGIAVNRTHEREDRRSQMHWIANVAYEWEKGLRARVSDVEIERKDRSRWLELGFGGSTQRDNGVRWYGEVSGKSAMRDIGNSYTIHATAGFNVQF